MSKSRITIAILLSLGILLFVILYCVASLNNPVRNQDTYFQIKTGAGLNVIIDQLSEEEKISTPPIILKVYAYLTRHQGGIKAGEYDLTTTLTSIEILEAFRQGRVVQRGIVFPEGLTFTEWKAVLASNIYIQHTIADQSDLVLMKKMGSELNYAEGQFFPDTYYFNRGASDISILKKAYDSMQQVLSLEWENRDVGVYLDDPQAALVFASMVEKETGYGPDRDLIASVFSNRLRLGMKMQSDPTVIYGLKDFDGDLKRSHLRAKSPFNTYVISALPPTPICNPGLAAIRASLHPPMSEYFYFVARGDGSSQFSETLAQHNSAVRKYQLSGKKKAKK